MKLVSVQEMIKIEKAADSAGQPYAEMMEAAGQGLAVLIHEKFSILPEQSVTALVGSGNNGGDALVALDYLISWGWQATAILCGNRPGSDPLILRFLENGGRLIDCYQFENSISSFKEEISGSEVLIDGVLGTGIKLPLRKPLVQILGDIKTILEQIETTPVIVAVDCPSGIDCDTGDVDPACIPADLTVTMAAVKKGLLRFPAYNYLGKLEVVDIGLPAGLDELDKINREIVDPEWVRSKLPVRPLNAHKGTFGTSLIIAGSEHYPGAAILAGISAYRAGSGLVTMAVPRGIYQGLIKTLPEATWVKLNEISGGISEDAVSQIKSALGRPTACLLGPGLGTLESTGKFLEGFFQLEEIPALVIDADGLRLVSELADWQTRIPQNSVLTPHPGEMAVLTGVPSESIQSDRLEIAEKFAQQWGQIIVLKGAHTIIAAPGEKSRILISADPALARAGSGDVLAGLITGLLAQGVTPYAAAVSGTWIHARAGALAAKRVGSAAAVLAGDISSSIGQVISSM